MTVIKRQFVSNAIGISRKDTATDEALISAAQGSPKYITRTSLLAGVAAPAQSETVQL